MAVKQELSLEQRLSRLLSDVDNRVEVLASRLRTDTPEGRTQLVAYQDIGVYLRGGELVGSGIYIRGGREVDLFDAARRAELVGNTEMAAELRDIRLLMFPLRDSIRDAE